MEAEERISLERRLGQLEKSIATYDALLRRNTEILDEIRAYINKPTNWAEWLVAAVSILALAGTLLYTAYIKPLEERVDYIKDEVIKNRNDILTISGYTKETKGVLNEYIITQAASSNTTDN